MNHTVQTWVERAGSAALILWALLWACALVMLVVLPGCPAPVPLRPDQCHTDATTESCGICASESVCAWCASAGPDRGCVARDDTTATCSGTLLHFPEACEGFPDEYVFEE